MSKLPLINRRSPIKLLDTDKIEINRKLPNGDIIALKINVSDISRKCKLPGLDVFDPENKDASVTKALRSAVNSLPILPSRSGYGIVRSIGEILWINNSYEPDLLSLALLKEVEKDTAKEWWAEIGVAGPLSEPLRKEAIEVHLAFIDTLNQAKAIIVSMAAALDNRKTDLLNWTSKNINVSALETWLISSEIVKTAIDKTVADTNAKVEYLKNPPKVPKEPGDKRDPEEGPK